MYKYKILIDVSQEYIEGDDFSLIQLKPLEFVNPFSIGDALRIEDYEIGLVKKINHFLINESKDYSGVVIQDGADISLLLDRMKEGKKTPITDLIEGYFN